MPVANGTSNCDSTTGAAGERCARTASGSGSSWTSVAAATAASAVVRPRPTDGHARYSNSAAPPTRAAAAASGQNAQRYTAPNASTPHASTSTDPACRTVPPRIVSCGTAGAAAIVTIGRLRDL